MTALIATRGFFRNMLDAMIEARHKEAHRMVDAYETTYGRTRADGLARRHISSGY